MKLTHANIDKALGDGLEYAGEDPVSHFINKEIKCQRYQ